MPTIADIRQQAGGAYDDMSDAELANGIYNKFYSDMPREQFDSKIGLGTAAAPPPADQRSFLEKLGSFARNVYANPPPTIAGVRDIIKGAPAAATELTWGADPEAAKAAAGTMLQAAMLAPPTTPGLRAGEGVAGRAFGTPEARAALPQIAPPLASEEAIQAAGRLSQYNPNLTLPKYMATESTALPQFAAGIKNMPWGGEPIVQSARHLGEQLGIAKTGIVGPETVTAETAGESAAKGIGSWIAREAKGPISAAYDKVDALIDPAVMTPLNNTANTVAQIIAERANARIPGGSKAADIAMQAIQSPMDYEGIKRLRSYLGEKTPQTLIAEGINPIEAKRIYGALTEDLKVVIGEAGGPQALAAWQEANVMARLTKAQQNLLSKIVGPKGDVAPEQVFNKLMSFAGSTSGADLRKLSLAKQAMGRDAWNEVGSALISRLGQAPDGTFSPDRFVTAFGKLAPAARNELFSPVQHAALNDLMTLSQYVRDRISRFTNVSGTSRGNISFGYLGGMFLDPISALGTVVSGRLIAHAISQPAIVRAATDVSRASLTRNPMAAQRAMNRLRDVVARAGLISASVNMPRQNPLPESPPQ